MGKTLGTYNKRVHESPAARQRAKAFKDKSQIDARNALKGKMGTNLFGNKRYYPMGLVKSMPGTMAKRFQKYGIMTLKAPPKANLNSIQRKNLRKGIQSAYAGNNTARTDMARFNRDAIEMNNQLHNLQAIGQHTNKRDYSKIDKEKVKAVYKSRSAFNNQRFRDKSSKYKYVAPKGTRKSTPSQAVYINFVKNYWAKNKGKSLKEGTAEISRMWKESKAPAAAAGGDAPPDVPPVV